MSAVNIIAGVLLIGGFVFMLISAIGVMRFPDFFTRLHAAGVGDTLGVFLIILGMIVTAGLHLISIKLFLIFIFLLLSNPLGTNLIIMEAIHERNYQGYRDKRRVVTKAENVEEGEE